MSKCGSQCDDDSWTGSFLVTYKEDHREKAKSFIEDSAFLALEEMLPYQTLAVSGPKEVVNSLEEIEHFESVEPEYEGKTLTNGNIRPYTEETVVGHRVNARIDEDKVLPENVRERIREMSGGRSPMIEITVGDVDWEESKSVRVRLDTLRNIVEHFEDAEAEANDSS